MCLTCIELDISGAHFSSLQTFPTLLCTLTNAFISLDCNKVCKKLNSCSLVKLSASFNDATNFDKTVNQTKTNTHRVLLMKFTFVDDKMLLLQT